MEEITLAQAKMVVSGLRQKIVPIQPTQDISMILNQIQLNKDIMSRQQIDTINKIHAHNATAFN